jgi:hypothetical protein
VTFEVDVTVSRKTFQANNTVSRNSFTGNNTVSRNEFDGDVTTQFPGSIGAITFDSDIEKFDQDDLTFDNGI